MTPEELAHFAGLVDAMGRISVRTTPDDTALPVLDVSSPNTGLLAYLGERTGTTPLTIKRAYTRHRCTEHCTQPHDNVVSKSGRWQVFGARATVVLAAVLPYLRLQNDAAREALAVGIEAPRKPATQKKMAALGWPMPPEW
jgi:hypothetical protein